MSSNIDSEIIKNLRSSGDQNKLEQTSFSSMVLNDTTIKGGNNVSTSLVRYNRSKSKPNKKLLNSNILALILTEQKKLSIVDSRTGIATEIYSIPENPDVITANKIRGASVSNFGNSWIVTGYLQPEFPLGAPQALYVDCFIIYSSGDLVTYRYNIPQNKQWTVAGDFDGEVSTTWGKILLHFFVSGIGSGEVLIVYIDMLEDNIQPQVFELSNPEESITVETSNYGSIFIPKTVNFFTGSNGTFLYFTSDISYSLIAPELLTIYNNSVIITHILDPDNPDNSKTVPFRNLVNEVGYSYGRLDSSIKIREVDIQTLLFVEDSDFTTISDDPFPGSLLDVSINK